MAKPVRDPHLSEVWVYRYRCCHCRRTFRYYPEGVDRADQTERIKILAVLGWMLGMSYRGLVGYLGDFGVHLGRMTYWCDVQEQAERYQRERHWRPVRVLGLDGAYLKGWGDFQPVLIAVDLGTGQPIAWAMPTRRNPKPCGALTSSV